MYMTKDGYINTAFRIPGKKGTPNTIGKPKNSFIKKPVVVC